jgi:Thiol:disulfide interchange protein DsbD, N-terminal
MGVLAVGAAAACALGQNRSMMTATPVTYLYPEQVTVTAGQPSQVELHFQVAQGLHINSHTPSQDYLIPTTFSIPAASGTRLVSANYPPGSEITLPMDPKTPLSVYTGEFTIAARIVAQKGNHLVEAQLHYQACNQSQCLPPKTIPVAIDVIAK